MNLRQKSAVNLGNEERRHRWVAGALSQLKPGGKIIDVGAGTQRYRSFCSHLLYTSQDFGKYDGKGDRSGLQTGAFDYGKIDLECDLTAIPVPDCSFDVVLCTEVLEHVPRPEQALMEMARILRPDGELILTAPFVSYTHFSPYHFCTGFSRYYYEYHLPVLGFDIIEMSPNGDFFDLQAQELVRLGAMVRQYTGRGMGFVDRVAQWFLLRALDRFSARGADSWRFACQGFHVRAKLRK